MEPPQSPNKFPRKDSDFKVQNRSVGKQLIKDIYQQLPIQQLQRKQSESMSEKSNDVINNDTDFTALFDLKHEKVYGTTIHIGQIDIETVYGTFTCHTFQNLITKGYVLALACGDLNAPTLYTRIHSSCVTSENMRSLDCDCVLQLEGAMKKISENKNGILFYLIQEGRGCGYVGKSRGCMFVQYTLEKMNTFQAYSMLGMKKDYREYDSIKDILKMLQIDPNFVLLTNNPDKIEGLKNLGVKVTSIAAVEFKPNPFNQDYLMAKAESGHLLFETKNKQQKYQFPFDPLEPFEPYNLPGYSRFIHVSSYYLPIKPVKYSFLVYQDDMANLRERYGQNIKFTEIYNGKYLIQFNDTKKIENIDEISMQPYWINVNVYYDIQTNQDYIILVYKDIGWENRTPIVRIQSESIIDRFPLQKSTFKTYYKHSLSEIIQNGYGMIAIFYNDGQGHGFGNYVIGKTTSLEEQLRSGINRDIRDYLAVSILIKHQLVDKNEIDLLYSCPYNEEKSQEKFLEQGIKVRKMRYIGMPEKRGIEGFEDLNIKVQRSYSYLTEQFPIPDVKLDEKENIYIVGIGTSESHAKYLEFLMSKYTKYNAKFVSIMEMYADDFQPRGKLIVFTQGLSPNSYIVFKKYDYKNIILFTAVTRNESAQNPKQEILKKLLENGSTVINFPIENEYETLVRIEGPICGYLCTYNFVCQLTTEISMNKDDIKQLNQIQILQRNYMGGADENFIQNLLKSRSVVIISGMSLVSYLQNIQYKFIEGMFINSVQVKSYLEFVHGMYQSIEYNRVVNNVITNVVILRTDGDQYFYDNLLTMLDNNFPIWSLNSSLSNNLKIVEYELCVNYLLLQIIERSNINQKTWHGMDRQHYLYNVQSFDQKKEQK